MTTLTIEHIQEALYKMNQIKKETPLGHIDGVVLKKKPDLDSDLYNLVSNIEGTPQTLFGFTVRVRESMPEDRAMLLSGGVPAGVIYLNTGEVFLWDTSKLKLGSYSERIEM